MSLFNEIAERVGWTKREREVFIYMFSTPGYKTWKETGSHFGLTPERIRQIHSSTMRRLLK